MTAHWVVHAVCEYSLGDLLHHAHDTINKSNKNWVCILLGSKLGKSGISSSRNPMSGNQLWYNTVNKNKLLSLNIGSLASFNIVAPPSPSFPIY